MTFIRIISDIHNEFGLFDLPELPEDAQTVLIIAGDCSVNKKEATYKPFFDSIKGRFLKVIYIPGNHEYYLGSITNIDNKYREYFKDTEVSFVNKETVIINDIAFVCATLWTDFNNADYFVMQMAEARMNDYRRIRIGPVHEPYQKSLSAANVLGLHRSHINFIKNEVPKYKAEGKKVVVVSHHSPSSLSVPAKYRMYTQMNFCYFSAQEDFIIDSKPDIWIHGHTHHSFDYQLGDTRIICNPRGYHGHEINYDFNPLLRIEL